MNFYLASSNAHKCEEFNRLFSGLGLIIEKSPQSLEVVEDGSTFQENALLKAKAYFEHFNSPVMSDDSGLVVEALPEELGIHSARFGGDELDQAEKNSLLLEKLKNETNRNAYFVCVLCFYLSKEEIYFFEGHSVGKIAGHISGANGFGYDPLFIPEKGPREKTFAELNDWKQEHGHRAKAVQEALKFFEQYYKK